MPRNVLTPEEINELEKWARVNDVVTIAFQNEQNNPIAFNAAAGGFDSYTADKDYAIVGVGISGITKSVTTPLRGWAGLTFQNSHNHLVGSVQGDVIAALMFKVEGRMDVDLNDRNIYLEKGRTIYAHLHNESASGLSACYIVVALQPTYKQ